MENVSSERQSTRKRKAQASNTTDGSGDEGKKRGRPRVVKQDESAADVGSGHWQARLSTEASS